LEETGDFSYGPPSIQKPTHELYADWLLSHGRYEEALSEYEKALKRCPGRRLSALGKESSSASLKQSQSAGL